MSQIDCRSATGEASLAAPDRVSRWHWLALGLIILLGGSLRFAYLTRPCLWGDEALTFGRVASGYQDLLDVLQRDGFVPLHYELYWLIGRFFVLTPWTMRLVPALAGTLMVPAMYFLARQMLTRQAALAAALLTACSAYMLAYSRDAKMYMDFWLFLTLHIASLLWWLRSGRRVAWLAWVAAGVAMVDSIPLDCCFWACRC